MKELADKIRDFVLGEIQSKLDALEISTDAIDETFNLVDSGVLDSLGFIEMVGAVESAFDFEMNFEELEPGEFTNLDGFVRCSLDSKKSA